MTVSSFDSVLCCLSYQRGLVVLTQAIADNRKFSCIMEQYLVWYDENKIYWPSLQKYQLNQHVHCQQKFGGWLLVTRQQFIFYHTTSTMKRFADKLPLPVFWRVKSSHLWMFSG